MNTPIRIMIVDDHILFRSGLALLLGGDRRVLVVGEGATGAEAIRGAELLLPDLMLLDVEMADGMNTESVIRRLNRSIPSMSVVVLTMHNDHVLRRQLLRAGATGFATKNISGPDLIELVIQAFRPVGAAPVILSEVEVPKALLSDRELQVLNMIGQAQSNRDISTQLSIAEGTAKRHTTNIYAKLGATSRIDAVRKATRLGLF